MVKQRVWSFYLEELLTRSAVSRMADGATAHVLHKLCQWSRIPTQRSSGKYLGHIVLVYPLVQPK